MNPQPQLLHMLLVEDDDDHAYLIDRNMKSSRIANTIDRVTDGEQALDYLYARGTYTGRKRPDLVLLDLKLPRVDGHEVLQTIKADDTLKDIPVVMLTTSASETDRSKAYLHHANSYVVKPLDIAGFDSIIKQLNLYWGMVNLGPPT